MYGSSIVIRRERHQDKFMRTPLMWLVNSRRSSSLIVWLTFALEPRTVTFPALVVREEV